MEGVQILVSGSSWTSMYLLKTISRPTTGPENKRSL